MSDSLQDKIVQVARLLTAAERVCCMTGAGVSAESGVPTFREKDGLWEGRRPEEVATPEAFAADPEDVWRFYLWRRQALATVKPNPGHYALATLEERLADFALITQNVDGLHRLAGSRHVIELHGDLWVNRCTASSMGAGGDRCPETRSTPNDGFETIPHCPACGAMMRPGVVWFGEMLPGDAFQQAHQAATHCQVMLVVGTSSLVQPAASLATWASTHGATVIEVNPNATPLSTDADICLQGPSGEVLPAVAAELSRHTC
ncbi:MAG: NAD-dependent deacylase [bacterium]|nr:NAD-dependent deacylase [bacterium]